MSAFSDYLENQVIDDYLRAGTVYVALHTSDPTDATATAATTEVGGASATGTYSAYARQAVTFSAGADGVTSNTANVDFPALGAGESITITHMSVWDASGAGAGNMLFHGPLGSAKPYTGGDIPSIPAGTLIITVQ